MAHIEHYFNTNSLEEKLWNSDKYKYMNRFAKVKNRIYALGIVSAVAYGIHYACENRLFEHAEKIYNTITALF